MPHDEAAVEQGWGDFQRKLLEKKVLEYTRTLELEELRGFTGALEAE